MKNTATIRAGDLAGAMKSASSVVQSSAIVPILANVKIDASGKAMVISTSDMEVLYQQTVPCVGELVTTVSARRISDIVSAAGSDTQLTLTDIGGRIEIKGGRSKWILPSLPADEFPSNMPMGDHCGAMEIEGARLAEYISRVAWAASVEISAPILASVFINADDGKVRFTASGRNMVMSLDTPDAWPKGAPDIAVPTALARLIERIASSFDGNIGLAWDGRKMRVSAGDITIIGKLVDGAYHDYRRALNAVGPSVCADPAAISGAVKRVRLASDDKTMIFTLSRTEGKISLSVNCPGTGEAIEEIPAFCDSELPDFGINAAYLMGMCDAVGGETIEIFQENDMAPAFFRRAVFDGAMGAIGAARVR